MSNEGAETPGLGGPTAAVTEAVRRRSRLARVWQWFWLGDELKAAHGDSREVELTFARRARAAAQVARRAVESPELSRVDVSSVASELYRQSIQWSLLALGAAQRLPAEQGSGVSAIQWHSVDSAALSSAIPDAEDLAATQSAVQSLTFVELGLAQDEERARLGENLRRLALALIDEVDLPQRFGEALRLKRALRLGLIGLTLVVLVLGVMGVREARERSRDLARGRPWQTSSLYAPGPGCKSPEQECAESPDYFFHTLDDPRPWIEFDLGSTRRISAVRVVNRQDCCMERAVPLVIEVSTDHKTWVRVARRDREFNSWLAEFPKTDAHWVRLSIEKRANLHLKSVRILP